MMKRLITICVIMTMLLAVSSIAHAVETISFTASDVKSIMDSYGAPLHDASNVWGLWAVRAMPIVGGNGIYTIDSGSTSQTGWGVNAPNGAFGASPYTATNSVWFWDASGAEAGLASNPLYMIMDVPATNVYSQTYSKDGVWLDHWAPGPDGVQGTGDDLGTFKASGWDGGEGGTNVVTAVSDSSTFTFSFTLDSGATWDGAWQFVVDGTKYTLGTSANPGDWVADFFGGYGETDWTNWYPMGLTGDMGAGYTVPAPGAILLAGIGTSIVGWLRRRRTL